MSGAARDADGPVVLPDTNPVFILRHLLDDVTNISTLSLRAECPRHVVKSQSLTARWTEDSQLTAECSRGCTTTEIARYFGFNPNAFAADLISWWNSAQILTAKPSAVTRSIAAFYGRR